MRHKSRSFAEKINGAKLLSEGIGKNLESLSPSGLDREFLDQFNEQRKMAEDLDAVQEGRKGKLKGTAKKLKEALRKLDGLTSINNISVRLHPNYKIETFSNA